MDSLLLAAEGGYQEFVLNGGEWAILAFSGAAAALAILVGFVLMRGVLAADQGTEKMIEIATAIQEGALAYLKRQFRTIIVILIPLAVVVFVTSTEVLKPEGFEDGTGGLSFAASGTARTVAFVVGAFMSGLAGYIGMTLATRGTCARRPRPARVRCRRPSRWRSAPAVWPACSRSGSASPARRSSSRSSRTRARRSSSGSVSVVR
jgi:hypothetical protein